MKISELSSEQIRLLSIAYDAFRETGDWPSMSYVDRVLDQQDHVDMDVILAGMPPGVVSTYPNYSMPQATVVVPLAGLRFVTNASDDIERFLQLVRACADHERKVSPGTSDIDELRLSRAEIAGADDVPQPNDALVRAFRIMQTENINSGSSGPDDAGNWTLNVNRSIRRYRDLRGLDDYLARRPEPYVPGPATQTQVSPFIFVVMPFGLDWSADVNDAIKLACSELSTVFAGLAVQRADEITEPGRITDQITSAIERADVVVADITGSNPNVLFELGYADALRKAIIVLNQHVEATPFDIRDWRQILYSMNALAPLRDTLVDFLTGTLLRAGFARQSP